MWKIEMADGGGGEEEEEAKERTEILMDHFPLQR